MPRSTLSAIPVLALLSGGALADDLPLEKLAEIQRDERKAVEQVNAAHGNKKPSEMSGEERRQLIQEQQSASQKVLNDHGVTAKDYARSSAALSREDRARLEQTRRQLEDRDNEDARQAKERTGQSAGAEQPIVIKRGLGDEQPVDVDDVDETPEEDAALANPGEGGTEGDEAGSAEAGAGSRHTRKAHAGH
jgi:hypothetical protein